MIKVKDSIFIRIALELGLISWVFVGVYLYFSIPTIYPEMFVLKEVETEVAFLSVFPNDYYLFGNGVREISLPIKPFRNYPEIGQEYFTKDLFQRQNLYLFLDQIVEYRAERYLFGQLKGFLIPCKLVPKNRLLRVFLKVPKKYFVLVHGRDENPISM